MTRKGNPNWSQGQSTPIGPSLPTEFELQVKQLQLAPAEYASSHELRHWCLKNRNRCYIPEWLLDAWNIPVDPDVSKSA